MKTKEKTGIRNGKLFCFNCGREYDMHLPQPVSITTAMMEQFSKDHENCAPTWKEPEAIPEQTIEQRANWWIARGETGSSSKTMWRYFMDGYRIDPSHPYDPDDFKRCYKLLEAVPEWKSRVHELAVLSPQWQKLSENWDKLNEYYLDQVKNKKANGMYEFMNKLMTINE
jgi:hypothetical protein